MKTQYFLLSVITLGFALSASAAVYKSVDEDGNVVFTDTPTSKSDTPVEMAPITTIEVTPAPAIESGSSEKEKQEQPKYESFAITQPASDQSIRSNNGDVTVQVSSTPPLKNRHLLVFFIDGNKLHEGTSAAVTLPNLDRGTHTMRVEIQDQKENTLMSDSVTFHLLRHSAQHAPRPAR